MKLKIFVVLIALLGVVAYSYYLFADFPPGPGYAEGDRDDTPAAAPPAQEIPEKEHDYMEDVLMLEQFIAGEKEGDLEELKRLARGEDALAYMANLALAEWDGNGLLQTPDIYYRNALDLYDVDEIRFRLAAWLVEMGRTGEGIEEYLLLLPEREAMEALEELEAPGTAIAAALLEGSHWQQAVDYLEEVLTDEKYPPAERLEFVGMLGESLARQGKYKEALPYLDEAYGGGMEEYAWWYARSLEGGGATAAAAAIYEKLGPAGAYRLGLILRDRGRKEEAARTLGLSDNGAALWQGARLWEELGRPEEAVQLYLQLARGDSRYKDDGAYRAYILMERGVPAGAEGADNRDVAREMVEILRDYPAWSMRLTGEAFFEENPTPEHEIPPFIQAVELLRQSGRHKMAVIELAIGQSRAELEDMLALGDWYLEQEDYFTATRWGIRSLNTERTRHGYHLAYQRPFEELVHEAARQYELEPHLIWAVMREESHFRQHAVSWVGARGLMQIMPATGQEIAGRKGVQITDGDLTNPEINIDFGAFYLRHMLDLFDGDVDKALAAYNGGQGNVRRWSNSPLGTTPADFPTVITFLETREYVTKVNNSYHTYNWLYGE